MPGQVFCLIRKQTSQMMCPAQVTETYYKCMPMRRFLINLVISMLFWPVVLDAEQIARVKMQCLSLRFERGAGGALGLDRLDLTTLSEGINGELGPAFGTNSHGCWIELYRFLTGATEFGVLYLNTPNFTDANGNGFDDFFEVSQSVSATSAGSWQLLGDETGYGVSATWTRAAGSAVGECVLELEGRGVFNHPFHLIEYAGLLVYQPDSNTVTASIALTNTAEPDDYLEAPVVLAKLEPNKFNRLQLRSGALTNAQGQVLTYAPTLVYRRVSWPTNYCAYVVFEDGNPNTPEEPDYRLWLLAIDDPNDTDADGIPDLSDDPVPPLARPPMLRLWLGTTNLLLEISGDVGHVYEILEADSVTATTWVTNQTLILTNDPQVISLPIPAGPTFWRARAY